MRSVSQLERRPDVGGYRGDRRPHLEPSGSLARTCGADGRRMSAAIAVGDILIEGGTYLPDSVTAPGESSLSGWSAVQSDRPTFEKAVYDAGWTLFFMAGDIKATVF